MFMFGFLDAQRGQIRFIPALSTYVIAAPIAKVLLTMAAFVRHRSQRSVNKAEKADLLYVSDFTVKELEIDCCYISGHWPCYWMIPYTMIINLGSC
jgi:hypothetical protein